jgi:hypothetical protein
MEEHLKQENLKALPQEYNFLELLNLRTFLSNRPAKNARFYMTWAVEERGGVMVR